MTFQPGDKLRVVADCGVDNSDDSSVPSTELRGADVQVAARNANYKHAKTGEQMVGVSHANGALSAIPARCLAKRRQTTSSGYSAGYAAAFDEMRRRGHQV